MQIKLGRIPIIIFSIGFILRLWFVFEYPAPLVKDALEYDSLAVSIVNGNGYIGVKGNPTATRPPGYPIFLSVIYLIFGKNYFIVRFIQAVIDSSLCVLIYYLGKDIFGEKVGILSGLLAAIHLGFIAQSAKIATEGLATYLLFFGIIFFHKARQNSYNKLYYILTGFIIGVASMVRPNFLIIFFLVTFVFIYDFLKKAFDFKTILNYLLVYLIAFIIPILPWTLRNYNVFHAFVPISTLQGSAFYSAYKPMNGKIYGFVPDDEITKKAWTLSSEVDRSRFLTKETMKLIKDNPEIFLNLLGLKMIFLFSPFDWELIYDRAVYNYLYVFYFPFFIIGSIALFNRFNNIIPLYLPVVGILITAVVLFGIPRFRIPIEPYMIILSSAAIISIYERILHKRIFISFLTIFLLINLLLCIKSDFVKQIVKIFLGNIGVW